MAASGFSTSAKAAHYFFPAEQNLHSGTIMAWPTRSSVDSFDIDETRREVALVAAAISCYEHLHLFTLDTPDNVNTARSLLGSNGNVSIHPIARLDCLWARDTGPIFVRSSDGRAVSGAVLNFNNWGDKLNDGGDSKVAASAVEALGVPAVSTGYVGEGGGLEVDGEGTLLATESSVLNANRNPSKSKEDIEAEFFRLFGVTKTIWLKGVKGHDITDCHIDALARFVSPGLAVLTKPSASHPRAEKEVYEDAKMRLSKETDAKGRSLRVVELPEPDYAQFEHQPCVSYVNYYVANGAIIAPKFGDEKADAEARRILGQLFPDRMIEQVLLRQLPVQGGGIHCATQQMLS
jgi:agmatine deiminase